MKKSFSALLAGVLLCGALAACTGEEPFSDPEPGAPGSPLAVWKAALPDDQSLLDDYDYTWYYDGTFLLDEGPEEGWIFPFLTKDREKLQVYLNDELTGQDIPTGFGLFPRDDKYASYTGNIRIDVRVYLQEAPGRDVPAVKSVVALNQVKQFEEEMLAPTLEVLTQADPSALIHSGEAAILAVMEQQGVARAIRDVSPTGRVYYQAVEDGQPQYRYFYANAADHTTDLQGQITVYFLVWESSGPTFLENFQELSPPDLKDRWAKAWVVDAMDGSFR